MVQVPFIVILQQLQFLLTTRIDLFQTSIIYLIAKTKLLIQGLYFIIDLLVDVHSVPLLVD